MILFGYIPLFDAVLFFLGTMWWLHLWQDFPKHIKDLKNPNPKVEKWPIVVVLGFSLLIARWMTVFVLDYIVYPLFDAI